MSPWTKRLFGVFFLFLAGLCNDTWGSLRSQTSCRVRLWLIARWLSLKSVFYLQEDSILASVSSAGMADEGLRL